MTTKQKSQMERKQLTTRLDLGLPCDNKMLERIHDFMITEGFKTESAAVYHLLFRGLNSYKAESTKRALSLNDAAPPKEVIKENPGDN